MSRLVQEDLLKLIDDKWDISDGGVTPGGQLSNPSATFFIVQSGGPVHRAKGQFFRVELRIDSQIDGLTIHNLPNRSWIKTYEREPHMVCLVKMGDSALSRWSSHGQEVCSGVFGLINTPDASQKMADKLRVVIDSFLATGAIIHPH